MSTQHSEQPNEPRVDRLTEIEEPQVTCSQCDDPVKPGCEECHECGGSLCDGCGQQCSECTEWTCSDCTDYTNIDEICACCVG